MNSECLRIADQLRQAFVGDPWLGPPLRDALKTVTPQQASRRLTPGTHSIWEIVAHIDLYVTLATEAISGSAMPRLYEAQADWPEIVDVGADAWATAIERLFENAERLAGVITGGEDSRLGETVPGREYNFYFLLHGVVQHSVYHGGQIALISRALAG